MSTTPPPPEEPERPEPDPSEQPTQAAPPPPPPPPRRFLRSTDDRVLAGVAGGLARYFSIDPVLVRIAFVVLTFFGGAGALAYLGAMLLVPSDTGDGSAPAPAPERNRWLVILGLVLIVLIGLPITLAIGGVLVPFAFLALAGLAVGWLVTGKRPEREAGPLVRTTLLGIGVLVLCLVLAVAAFWAAGVGGEGVVAGIVIAAGVAVLAGAFVRPVRWLVLPALFVAIPAAFASAAGIQLDGGYGERVYRPGAAAEVAPQYELGAGRLVVDLRNADLPAGRHEIEIDLGMGEAVVVVPADACVATDAKLGMGGVDVFDRDGGGIDVDFVEQGTPDRGAPLIVLDADIGLGHLDVRTTDPDHFDGFDHRGGPDRDFDPFDDSRPDLERGSVTGCA